MEGTQGENCKQAQLNNNCNVYEDTSEALKSTGNMYTDVNKGKEKTLKL
jgi:hypothetical protein